MKDIISDILSKHVEVYGFVSISEYLEKRKSLGIKDSFKFLGNLDKYKTIITLGICYPSEELNFKGPGYGILSRYSYNLDYHIVFNRILENTEQKEDLSGIDVKQAIVEFINMLDIANADDIIDYTLNLYEKC